MFKNNQERYIVFDVETPNRNNNRISAIGITIIENGSITNTFYSLVNPDTTFDKFNIKLTGISPDMVKDKPNFPELWPTIKSLMDDGILVAHNATFDMSVLYNCLKHYCINWKSSVEYLCTYKIARKVFNNLPNKKLNTICDYLNINLNHHNASSDSLACAEILLYYMKQNLNLTLFTKSYTLPNYKESIFGKVSCPFCFNRYNKNFNTRCPMCDGIDFKNISLITIIDAVEKYHEETRQEFDIVMSNFLTELDGWQHYETVDVTETVYDGIEYTFHISYKNNLQEERTYLETSRICQKLLELESGSLGLSNALDEIQDDLNNVIQEAFNIFNPKVETIASNWQSQVIAVAQNFCESYSCSKLKLIEYLEDREFSKAQAIYGADNCEVSFYEQAVKAAQNTLSSFAYSYKSMVVCLERDLKFTHDEAIYGADNCGADWKVQAVKSARKFLKNSDYTYEKMIFQLEIFHYTKEECEYAAKVVLLQNNDMILYKSIEDELISEIKSIISIENINSQTVKEFIDKKLDELDTCSYHSFEERLHKILIYMLSNETENDVFQRTNIQGVNYIQNLDSGEKDAIVILQKTDELTVKELEDYVKIKYCNGFRNLAIIFNSKLASKATPLLGKISLTIWDRNCIKELYVKCYTKIINIIKT